MTRRPRSAGLMTIGELSRRAGVSIKTLRQYADAGLVYTRGRSSANYRLFDSGGIDRVVFIRKTRGLGLFLADITEVFDAEQGAGRCETLRALVHARIDEIDARIAQLGRYAGTAPTAPSRTGTRPPGWRLLSPYRAGGGRLRNALR